MLARDAGSLAHIRLDPDDPALAKALSRTAEALAINFPGRTSEVRWTDRVFAFARMFDTDMMFPAAVPACAKRPDLGLLYATATARGALVCLGTGARHRPESLLWPQAGRTAAKQASLVEWVPRRVGQVAVAAPSGGRVRFAVEPTYPSYGAMGVVQVYVNVDPEAPPP